MKKLIALLALALLSMATVALATATDVSTCAAPKFQASANVKVFASSNDTTFAAISKHLNGTRTFGVSSGDTKVMYIESVAAGTDITSSTLTASDSSAFGSTWTSM